MRQILFTLLTSVLSATLVGCATPPNTTTPYLDSQFGHSVNIAKAQQTLNPDASLNTDPVNGMSGKEGNLVIDAYYDTLKPPPVPATVINIGGGLSGGSSR